MSRVLFILLFLPVWSFGQNEWSLQRCIDSALINNPDIQLAGIDNSISQINYSNSTYGFLPSLSGGLSHGYNWGQTIDPFTNQFATDRVQYNNFYLSSSVTLFSGLSQLYERRILEYEKTNEELKLALLQRDKKIEMTAAFFQSLLNEELEKVAESSLEISLKELKRVEALLEEGVNVRSDLLGIRSQIARDSSLLQNQRSDVELSRLLIQQLAGIKYDSLFRISNNLIMSHDSSSSTSIESQISNNDLNIQELSIKKTRSQFLPILSLNGSLGSGYSENNQFISPNGSFIPKPFDEQLNENFYQSITATLTIPIFNNNSTKKAIELDKLELDKIKIENERRNQVLTNRQLQMSIEIRNRSAQVSAAESSLESAILAYENSSLLFSEGQISSLDFFRVRNEMITAESELKQAVFSLELSQVIYSILNVR